MFPTRLLCSAVIVLGTVAATLAVAPGPAAAASLACGDTITVDTTLHADLTGCANRGLVVVA